MPTFYAPKMPNVTGPLRGYYEDLWRQRYQQAKREYDLEYFDRYGFFPEQRDDVRQAQEAAEAEYRQLVGELQGAIGSFETDPVANRIRDHYTGVMGGRDLPFGGDTLAALESQAAAPIYAGARNQLGNLRSSFASRGLGRAGTLGSLEQQILTQAIQQATGATSRLRSEAALQNFGARERAAGGLGGFYGQQNAQRNQLINQLANLRAQRQFDPTFFQGGQNRNYQTAGSQTGYKVPPPIDRRRAGRSAPQYNFVSAQWGL